MNQTYVVKPGDTLYGISNQFGVSVTDLLNINNVNPSNLKVGEVLTIPSATGSNPNNMIMYTVRKGDTLYSIANNYNTSVQELIKLNNLQNTNLSIGQTLKIPEMYNDNNNLNLSNYINYTVKKGDTLYSIARNNNISVDTILKDNNLSNNNLSVGQNLKIRIVENSANEIEECFGQDYTPNQNTTFIYTVKKGDSLYKIANNYNTTVSEIVSLNNLNNTNLSIGQQLKIPNSSGSSTSYYIVKKGDSLYSIAKKFNTSVDTIKKKNNLSTNLLSIGQKLII